MATADLKQLKPQYLKFIDLIRAHRIKELGKIGPTYVPKAEIKAIAPEYKIKRFIDRLINDGFLGSKIKENKSELVFNCLKTAEQIQEYKRSLIIEGALGIKVDDHDGNYYEMYRNGYDDLPPKRLSDEEGRLLYYLVDHADVEIDRDELANRFKLTPVQISSRLNTIRRKLTQLGFSEQEVEQIIPSYLRGKVVFKTGL